MDIKQRKAAKKAAREEYNKLPLEEKKKQREAEKALQKRMDDTAYY